MYLFLKRLLDILIAGFALLVFSPILIPIALILKLTGEGEVFYFQKRIGYKNKPFDIWKFATMLKNSPNMGVGGITVKGDSRVLPVGKFLRVTKINELPQIINVLIGNMSIVGARPLLDHQFAKYKPEVQKEIYATRPGITGIGSIIFRDEEAIIDKSDMPPLEFYAKEILPYKGELEMWYQKNKSLWLDITLIFLTAWSILFSKNTLANKWFKDLPQRPF
jgi:lipopolysaccharide/colanic/teichoic acid biosynthesis glycosyltransferase